MIIKNNIPVIIGETLAETKNVFQQKANAMNSCIVFAEDNEFTEIDSDLKGSYQTYNKRTVLAALEVLKSVGWQLDDHSISMGIANTVKNTGLRGRWEVLQTEPKAICDTAHNKEGLKFVLQQLQEEPFVQLHIVLGVVNDKDLESILLLFPKTATYYFCKPNVPRGLDEKELEKISKTFNLLGRAFSSVEKAYLAANENAKNNDLIYVGGSTFTVAEII